MLTQLNTRPQRVDLNLRGYSHGRNAELTATEDTFNKDEVHVKFQVGDHTPGRRRIVQLTQRPVVSNPDITHIRGSLTHQGLVHPLAAIVTPPDEDGVTIYRGQVQRDDLFLRQSTNEFGDKNVRGRVGNNPVELTIRSNHGRVDVSGSVGRESLSLSGYDHGGAKNIPLPGLISAIACSAFFNSH